MSIIFKHQNCREKLEKEILFAAIDTEPMYAALGLDLVVTSGGEKYKHSANRSGHYRGDAIDLRTKNLPKTVDKKDFTEKVKRNLGSDYVVLLENFGGPYEHIHVHWSPIFHR